MPPNSFRAFKALVQVRRQRRVFDASYGVIWLPHARTSFASYHWGILVVGGQAEYLISQIRGMMQCFAVVQFGHVPSFEIRTLIKASFWYDTQRYFWEGGCSEKQAQYLRPLLKLEGGTLTLFRTEHRCGVFLEAPLIPDRKATEERLAKTTRLLTVAIFLGLVALVGVSRLLDGDWIAGTVLIGFVVALLTFLSRRKAGVPASISAASAGIFNSEIERSNRHEWHGRYRSGHHSAAPSGGRSRCWPGWHSTG